MAKALKITTVFSFFLSVLASVLFLRFRLEPCLTLAITFGTVFYHLAIRLCVGFLYHVRMQNRADYTKKWYQHHPWEGKLYAFLHGKARKSKCPHTTLLPFPIGSTPGTKSPRQRANPSWCMKPI